MISWRDSRRTGEHPRVQRFVLRLQYFPKCRRVPTLEGGSGCRNRWTHSLHWESVRCKLSNMVWESSDRSFKLFHCLFCFSHHHRLLCFPNSVEGQKLIMSLYLIVSGVPDKTKTKEFQVEHVSYWSKVLPQTQALIKQRLLCLNVYHVLLTRDLLSLFSFSLQWFICRVRRRPSKWEKVGLPSARSLVVAALSLTQSH